MKSIYTLMLALLLTGSLVQAQTLERQVIGAAGGFGTAAGIQLSSTVGEAATTTLQSGAFILSQGFQQGDLFRVGIDDPGIRVSYQLYPNPTTGQIVLELEAATAVRLTLELTDMRGRAIALPEQSVMLTPRATLAWDLSHLAEGTYLITLRDPAGNAAQTLRFQKQ
ncbi:MAG: T9SS type A sorting domain-containing protein [Bacteroidia bacterium]|nr:T9SS type A sorting domain-containing protein [Bacteroidia bacterium]